MIGQLTLAIQGFVLKHAFLHLTKDRVVPNIDIHLPTSFAMCVSDYRIRLQFRIWNSFAGSHYRDDETSEKHQLLELAIIKFGADA